jgi:hypothetical protein
MEPIVIDIGEVVEEYNLSTEKSNVLMRKILEEILYYIRDVWTEVARERLKSTRDEYIKSIYVGEEGIFAGYVTLRGVLPNMIEDGVEPFDMKIGFSKSNKKKISKSGGWYLTIPFRWFTSNALSERGNILPLAIQKKMKEKQANEPKLKPLKLTEIPKEFQQVNKRNPISTKNKNFPEYTHKSPTVVGMTHSKGSSGGGGKYITFRRVSSNSDPNSWIHSGIQAYKLAETAMTKVERNIRAIVDGVQSEFISTL